MVDAGARSDAAADAQQLPSADTPAGIQPHHGQPHPHANFVTDRRLWHHDQPLIIGSMAICKRLWPASGHWE